MGLFDFFKNKTSKIDLPYSVDMHSHVLPGIDDGAANEEESFLLINGLDKLGCTKLIPTPHIMGDFYKNTESSIQMAYEKLWEKSPQIIEQHIPRYAAEYYIDESFGEKLLKNEKLLTLGKNYLLVETSYINKPHNFRNILFELQSKGYKVVLAHPERYSYMHGSFEIYEEMIELSVFFQLNFTSLSGYYGPMAKKISEKLLEKGMVSFLGSDCHKVDHLIAIDKALENPNLKFLSKNKILNDSLV